MNMHFAVPARAKMTAKFPIDLDAQKLFQITHALLLLPTLRIVVKVLLNHEGQENIHMYILGSDTSSPRRGLARFKSSLFFTFRMTYASNR